MLIQSITYIECRIISGPIFEVYSCNRILIDSLPLVQITVLQVYQSELRREKNSISLQNHNGFN